MPHTYILHILPIYNIPLLFTTSKIMNHRTCNLKIFTRTLITGIIYAGPDRNEQKRITMQLSNHTTIHKYLTVSSGDNNNRIEMFKFMKKARYYVRWRTSAKLLHQEIC